MEEKSVGREIISKPDEAETEHENLEIPGEVI